MPVLGVPHAEFISPGSAIVVTCIERVADGSSGTRTALQYIQVITRNALPSDSCTPFRPSESSDRPSTYRAEF